MPLGLVIVPLMCFESNRPCGLRQGPSGFWVLIAGTSCKFKPFPFSCHLSIYFGPNGTFR